MPGALVRQPDSPSYIDTHVLRTTARALGVGQGIKRGGRERHHLHAAIARAAVVHFSPAAAAARGASAGRGSSSSSSGSSSSSSGLSSAAGASGSRSSASSSSSSSSGLSSAATEEPHPMLAVAEQEAGTGGGTGRMRGTRRGLRPRGRQRGRRPRQEADAPLLRNVTCPGCQVLFTTGDALGAHFAQRTACNAANEAAASAHIGGMGEEGGGPSFT